MKHVFSFPRQSFNWYKSAEAHTHKRRIPARAFFLLAVPFLVVGFFYYGITYVQRKHEAQDVGAVKTATGVPIAAPGVGAGVGAPVNSTALPKPRYQRVSEYIADRQPFLQGFPHTAPIYQEVTKPRTAPVPSACISSRKHGCKCYTQQATIIADMPQDMCQQIVATGYGFADRSRVMGP